MFRSILLCIALSSITIEIVTLTHAPTDNLMDLLYVDRVECKFNKDMCKHTKCLSKFYNRTTKHRITKLLTVNCGTVVPFESIIVQTSLHYRFTGGYRQFAINIRNDWCKYVDGTEKSILLDLYVKFIEWHANYIRKCPLIGNLSVENVPMSAQLYGGQFLPAGDYYHQALMNMNRVHGLTLKMYFNIPAGQTIVDDAMGK